MPKKSKQSNRQLEQVLQVAAKLSPGELEVLHQGIQALMRDVNIPTTDNQNDDLDSGKGHVVRKMINGCGPYRYLRYRQKGKYKSIYLGKNEEG